jgi:hypothetical protein
MSTPVNFNGARPIIDPANAVMLLIESFKAQEVVKQNDSPSASLRQLKEGDHHD